MARTLTPHEHLARLADPVRVLKDAGEFEPHPEQCRVLRNWRRDHMLLWSRQAGKSSTGAALAVHNLLIGETDRTATVVIVSRALRQSSELFRKARELLIRLPYAPALITDSATVLEVPGGGRILSYPGSEETVRGLSGVTLALVDEATLLERSLVDAITPMMATTGAPLWSMATARGCSGWFYDDWTNSDLDPVCVKSRVTWADVPHLSPDFIEKERRRMPHWRFRMEYECSFEDAGEERLISPEAIANACNPEVSALW